jgi:hypothetical protein
MLRLSHREERGKRMGGKSIFVVVGVVVVLILLFTTGVLGGALCVKGIGCVYSKGNGLAVDSSTRVTVGTK